MPMRFGAHALRHIGKNNLQSLTLLAKNEER